MTALFLLFLAALVYVASQIGWELLLVGPLFGLAAWGCFKLLGAAEVGE